MVQPRGWWWRLVAAEVARWRQKEWNGGEERDKGRKDRAHYSLTARRHAMPRACANVWDATLFLFLIKAEHCHIIYEKEGIVYNAPKRTPHTNNTPNMTLHHHNSGDKPKECHRKLCHHCQRCATPNVTTRCMPEQQPELLHHGLSPSNHTRSLNSQSQWCISRTLPLLHRWKSLILATLRGGLASPTASHSSAKDSNIWSHYERLTSAQTTTRVTTPLSAQLKTSNTHGPSASSRQHRPCAPPHTLNTGNTTSWPLPLPRT
jgi:hypothetical protein